MQDVTALQKILWFKQDG